MIRFAGIETLEDLRKMVEDYLGYDSRKVCTEKEEKAIWRWLKNEPEEKDAVADSDSGSASTDSEHGDGEAVEAEEEGVPELATKDPVRKRSRDRGSPDGPKPRKKLRS